MPIRPVIPYFISTITVLKIKNKISTYIKENEIPSFEVLHIYMEMMEVILNFKSKSKSKWSTEYSI